MDSRHEPHLAAYEIVPGPHPDVRYRPMTDQSKPCTDDHSSDRIPVYNAADLVGQGKQAHLILDGQVYSLRITRAGKLILTK